MNKYRHFNLLDYLKTTTTFEIIKFKLKFITIVSVWGDQLHGIKM